MGELRIIKVKGLSSVRDICKCKYYCTIQFSSVTQSSPTLCDPMDCSTPGLCPSPPPEVCPSSCSLHRWCHLAISSSDTLFSFCLQSFPASGTFPMSHRFTSDDQNTGSSALASVLPVNIQSWSPLRLTGLISLLSKGLSGIFSSTEVQRHQFFGVLPSLGSSSHNCVWSLWRQWWWWFSH